MELFGSVNQLTANFCKTTVTNNLIFRKMCWLKIETLKKQNWKMKWVAVHYPIFDRSRRDAKKLFRHIQQQLGCTIANLCDRKASPPLPISFLNYICEHLMSRLVMGTHTHTLRATHSSILWLLEDLKNYLHQSFPNF